MSLNVLSLYFHSKVYIVNKKHQQETKIQLRNESVQLTWILIKLVLNSFECCEKIFLLVLLRGFTFLKEL